MPSPTLQKEHKQARYYTEPLKGLGSALPLDMILIPRGTFTMGSPENEPERGDNEGPQHQVTVPAFFMGRYPVTQAQWQAVTKLKRVERKLNTDPASFKGDNHPVETVSWYDAIEFCARLSDHTDRHYRLPSEAEWEYACRAGTNTPFYFGEILTTEIANYTEKLTGSDSPKGISRQGTTPVDEFKIANAFGLCDMHGNVYEWCQDYYSDSYKGASVDGSARVETGAEDYAYRLVRGGSWFDPPQKCRSANRVVAFNPGGTEFNIGFRIVCSAPRALQ